MRLPFDHPESKWMFDPEADIAVAITPAAKATVQHQLVEMVVAPPDPVSPPTAVPAPTPIQRAPETAVQRLPAMPDLSQVVKTAAAKTGLAEMMPDLETAVSPTEPTAEAEEPAPPEELDIDALSRRVYQALKRKLAVEWERGYGR